MSVPLQPTPAQLLAEERERYPAMLPREIVVWRAWLKLHAAEYDRISYNERVGEGFDPGPTWPANQRANAVANSKKRIDAVLYRGPLVTLVEVKDRATPSAVGQILAYRGLWTRAHPSEIQPSVLLVANRLAEDMPLILAHTGVPYELVPADFSELHLIRRGRVRSPRP